MIIQHKIANKKEAQKLAQAFGITLPVDGVVAIPGKPVSLRAKKSGVVNRYFLEGSRGRVSEFASRHLSA